MPSGRTHDRLTWLLLPGVTAIAYGVTRSELLTLAVSLAFLFSGLMFGPDLDIHSVQYKRWGWLRWLWLPYRKMLRHRSIFSHGLLVGTLFRLLYVLVIFTVIGLSVWGLGFLMQMSWQWDIHQAALTGWQFSQNHWVLGVAILIGLEIGAMSHSVSDLISTKIKKYHKPDRKKRKKRTGSAKSLSSKKY